MPRTIQVQRIGVCEVQIIQTDQDRCAPVYRKQLVQARYDGRVLIEDLLGTLGIEQLERPETQLNPDFRERRTQFPTNDPAKHLPTVEGLLPGCPDRREHLDPPVR